MNDIDILNAFEDFPRCYNKKCPKKNTCLRFTTMPNPHQYYLTYPEDECQKQNYSNYWKMQITVEQAMAELLGELEQADIAIEQDKVISLHELKRSLKKHKS